MASSLEGLEPITVSPQKVDPGWKHCQLFIKDGDNSVELKKCLYCGKMFQGGGIHRFKEHLAGRKGNGPICEQVPEDVRVAMQECLEQVTAKKKKKKNQIDVSSGGVHCEVDGQLVNQTQCKSIGVPVVLNSHDVGFNSVSVDVDRRIRGTMKNSFAVDTDGNGFELSDNLVSIRSDVGYATVHNGQLRSIGVLNSKGLLSQEEDHGMGNVNMQRRKRLRDVNSSMENPCAGSASTETNDNPSAISGENEDLLAEHTQCRLVSFSHSNHLFNQEEAGIGNGSVGKKRLIDNNSYAGEDGIVSSVPELERVNNQQIQVAIGRFLYEIAVPLDAVRDSVHFQPMIDAIASGGSKIVAPSCHDLRGWILKDVAAEVKNDVDWCTKRWANTGCSLLAGECNSGKGRTLLNFSVYCPDQTIFLKSVDISSILNTTDALHDLLKQVVEQVGVQHVLQVITNSDERYVVAGRRLMETLPTIYWSPCAAHCIGLMLEDFGKIEWIKSAIEQAKSVTRFIYNHTIILNIMRRYTFGIDIVKPGESLFATNFMTLKQMADLKLNLQSMVTSQEWIGSSFSNSAEGLLLADTLTNRSFWSCCILITRLVDPLLRALNIVSCQKRAAVGYIFAGIYRAKEIIKRELPKREDYVVYWKIIDHRWERLWHLPLHKAAEWWSTYGSGCPVLAHFAVRILSQTCSLVHQKSIQISFEQLNEARNCIEHQRLNDLAFVQYNMQLKQMSHKTKVQVGDPLSFDCKSVVEDWIMEKKINLQDNGCADWMSLDPPSTNLMLLELCSPEVEDLCAGFDDHEILNGLKEVKEEVLNEVR
ncbi:uncharacterized protein LOC133818271 isoform X2 [Humulus lupulus]|uniref:uncharacterized protein LOC133818271 isoform X2 n=1 Tax=Humulus lupulus TaxID=3486 RepID=UPI002B40B2AF|nr:uncharacterized protein LOC133818271 isoform X2 [Humulus lupulus]